MTKIIVTGAAGFIGSHLVDALVSKGYDVIGVDDFNNYYDPKLKKQNISHALEHKNFQLICGDIQFLNWQNLLEDVSYVFHQAAQAGVRASWGNNFQAYVERNISSTQILLEASIKAKQLKRFIFASTSSIYGESETLPTSELIPPKPISPYGITKLAAEQLGNLYYKNFDLPFVSLRYFSVYGPRQRPDMGFHKFFKAALNDESITIYGDGKQTRDFTFVQDIVEANLAAAESEDVVGEIINIGGGSRISLSEVLEQIEVIIDQPFQKNYIEPSKGDARHTTADISKAQKLLDFYPKTILLDGLTQEWNWIKSLF
jgi:UDP-glucose 4-epimerase